MFPNRLLSGRIPGKDAAVVRLLIGVVCGVAMAVTAGSAAAMPVRAAITFSFFPPSPCSATDLGDLSGATLNGTLAFFERQGRAGDLVGYNPGPPDMGRVACGATGHAAFNFDLAPGATLSLTFAGDLVGTNPGPPTVPVYAFPEQNPGPPTLPDTAPLIDLGTLGDLVGQNPGPPVLPVYAFASPGHLVGTLSFAFAVPEPSALAILAFDLAGLGFMRRRWTA